MGEEPLSTLSIPSLEAPPPRIAVKNLRPIDSKFAQGDDETASVSMLSLLLGPVVPGLKNICISIPESILGVSQFVIHLVVYENVL